MPLRSFSTIGDVESDCACDIGFRDQDHVGGVERERVFLDLVRPLRSAQKRDALVLAEWKSSGTDQVADIFNYNEMQAREASSFGSTASIMFAVR